MPINRFGRLPGTLSGRAQARVLPRHEASRALDPHHQNRPNSEKRPRNGRGKQSKNREFHAQEGTDHGHQLHIAESHAFDSARPQINCACPINE